MNKIALYGNIRTGNHDVVSRLLSEWLKTEKLDVKMRMGGSELTYKDAKLYLYCHSAATEPLYLLEGHTSGTLDDAKVLLQRLLQLCKQQKLVGRFEYVQVTEDGDEVGDQFSVE
jgi:hypothetical protein